MSQKKLQGKLPTNLGIIKTETKHTKQIEGSKSISEICKNMYLF